MEFPELVVYNNAQLLPEYLVTYRHDLACKCTHCILPVLVQRGEAGRGGAASPAG